MSVKLEIPDLCLVALIGASGSGKSTFAKVYFKETEILSSDYFRGLVSDDETDQSATSAAFESLYYIANKRLDRGKLTVVDATNVQFPARKKIVDLAREQNVFAAAIVLDMDEALCLERNAKRPGRTVPPHVVRTHIRDLKRSIRHLQKEGFRYVHILHGPEEAAEAEIVRVKLWNNKQDESGPFDIIGDIHGCYGELTDLLEKLGYSVDRAALSATPPPGRRAIFLGDLCDRGPQNAAVLRLVMNMAEAGAALCIPGNHDVKLLRKLRGADVKLTHGLDLTVKELEQESPAFIEKAIHFLDSLVSHYVLDQGRLVVSHAGLSEKLQGRSSGAVRSFCLYGDTTGETDEFGLPVRLNWAEAYHGKALVVYGHIPSREARSQNNTICIDTGCVFGGKLSAYRYPEGELVSVPAQKEYYAPVKPLDAEARQDSFDVADLLNMRRIQTMFHRDIPVSESGAAFALELMSRFSVDLRWLIYLPPTMSPCETSREADFLEHPAEAFAYYKKRGVPQVVCEEKHMGSRAVIVLCKNAETAKVRFGIEDENIGVIYTRTGRPFFGGSDASHEQTILARLGAALGASGFWETFATGWVCLDVELMPWSAKARALILEQYAPTGMAGRQGLAGAVAALQTAQMAHNGSAAPSQADSPAPEHPAQLPAEHPAQLPAEHPAQLPAEHPAQLPAEHPAQLPAEHPAQLPAERPAQLPAERPAQLPAEHPAKLPAEHPAKLPADTPGNMDIGAVLRQYRDRLECLEAYTQAYRRYCWQVASVDDYRIAPFHILATEGKVWHTENHLRHLAVIQEYIAGRDSLFTATKHLSVDLNDANSVQAGIEWWLALTGSGGEGMVVKPLDFIVRAADGELLQPAIKCRGREYLRIIYGPEYTAPQRLERLRKRSLKKKQNLALSEFALGMEALERFVKQEPFRRIHECVFAVLALENEAVDPRL